MQNLRITSQTFTLPSDPPEAKNVEVGSKHSSRTGPLWIEPHVLSSRSPFVAYCFSNPCFVAMTSMLQSKSKVNIYNKQVLEVFQVGTKHCSNRHEPYYQNGSLIGLSCVLSVMFVPT